MDLYVLAHVHHYFLVDIATDMAMDEAVKVLDMAMDMDTKKLKLEQVHHIYIY